MAGNEGGVEGNFCCGDQVCAVADVDGDRQADVVAIERTAVGGAVWVALSTGSGFATPKQWKSSFCKTLETCRLDDMNGDGRADLIRFTQASSSPRAYIALARPDNIFGTSRIWHDNLCSSSNYLCSTGDFTGDGRADAAVFVKGTDSQAGLWAVRSYAKY